MRAIFERASVRSFSDRPVEEEKLEQMLRAAMAAPSAGNQQPWEFYIVSDRETLVRLSHCGPYAGCVQNAPVAVVACCRTEGMRFPECIMLDMSAATENFLLAAAELGVGSVWLSIAPFKERMEAAKSILALPDGMEAFATLPCGYPLRPVVPKERFDPARIHRIF